MHETNEITLSLEAVMEAEIKANDLLEAKQVEVLAQLAQEEAAEVARMKKEMSLKRRAATELEKKKIAAARQAREEDYKHRRQNSKQALQSAQTEIQLCAKTLLSKADELGKATSSRIASEKSLDDAERVRTRIFLHNLTY
jgi:prolyl-tRNA editing enzyme YbaK/EbsC (Cys-tRNA(Pro) deacylase)